MRHKGARQPSDALHRYKVAVAEEKVTKKAAIRASLWLNLH